MSAPEGPVEGPKLPTAAERRAAVSLERRIRAARSFLRDNDYLVLDRFKVTEIIGAPFHSGFYSCPAPAVHPDGRAVRPAILR